MKTVFKLVISFTLSFYFIILFPNRPLAGSVLFEDSFNNPSIDPLLEERSFAVEQSGSFSNYESLNLNKLSEEVQIGGMGNH